MITKIPHSTFIDFLFSQKSSNNVITKSAHTNTECMKLLSVLEMAVYRPDHTCTYRAMRVCVHCVYSTPSCRDTFFASYTRAYTQTHRTNAMDEALLSYQYTRRRRQTQQNVCDCARGGDSRTPILTMRWKHHTLSTHIDICLKYVDQAIIFSHYTAPFEQLHTYRHNRSHYVCALRARRLSSTHSIRK